MEFLFELWIHRGVLGPYYAYMVEFQPVDARRLVRVNFVQAILSKFHA